MKIAYFDAFSGVSGDMTLGALLDLGVPLPALEAGLAPLGLSGFRLDLSRRPRSGIDAAKLDVIVEGTDHVHVHTHTHDGSHGQPHTHDGSHGHGDTHTHDHALAHPHEHTQGAPSAPLTGHGHGPHRPYREIRTLLARADLRPSVRDRAERIFRALAAAEGKIHGVAPDDVEFHEVGAVDAIVDIVGVAFCLDYLGIERIHCSPLPLGSGLTRSQHGIIPVPPPATMELLRGFPVRPGDGECELVTPTGAAILAALATPGPPPPLRALAVGYGAGERDLADRPNLLRIVLAEPLPAEGGASGWSPRDRFAAGSLPERDEMIVLEANIDDMNPELYEAAVEALFADGARDVSLSPITMKKGRPGTLLQVIAAPGDADRLAASMLRDTSTIGVRMHAVSRLTLPRARRRVSTPWGAVDVKVATLPDGSTRTTPEYDDARRLAREHGLALAAVYAAVQRAAADTPSD